MPEQVLAETDRKVHSLLELGQLIGLDLQLDEMLLQIAKKASEVMDADRFSIFLYDPASDELYTTVALGMGKEVIRVPADSGIAGYCFKTGKTVNLADAYADPRFNREIEAHTGYKTTTLLSMPFYNRAGKPLGAIQLLNKRDGLFTDDDIAFLQTFNNHAAVFIEMAQLQKARIDAIEESRHELERLNRAKNKAVNHISHELRTPIAVIQGDVRLLKRKLEKQSSGIDWQGSVEALERNIKRLLDIQRETDQIFRVSQELETSALMDEVERLAKRMEYFTEMPSDIRLHWNAVRGWMSQYLPGGPPLTFRRVSLDHFLQRIIRKIRYVASHRKVNLELSAKTDVSVFMSPKVLREVLEGLLKNAIENTPDGGTVNVVLEESADCVTIRVIDHGVGITEENQGYIFDGMYYTRETELYTSKKPFDFGAGGKGLDLLRMKIYAKRFGFDLSMESRRCVYIPTDMDLCPGDISTCTHCRSVEDCWASGGSTFSISFPLTTVETQADPPAKEEERR
jgi:signal transduction histidine kinase